jgi:hypothetical protein
LFDCEAGFDPIRAGWNQRCDDRTDRTDRDDEYRNHWKLNAKLKRKQRAMKERKELVHHEGYMKKTIQQEAEGVQEC